MSQPNDRHQDRLGQHARAIALGLVSEEVFDHFPFGLLVVDRGGHVMAANRVVEDMVGPLPDGFDEAPRCCELLGCNQPGTPLALHCLTELALDHGSKLPEVRLDLPTTAPMPAVWVTAAPLRTHVIMHLRPGAVGDRRRRTEPHWLQGPKLRIQVLGRVLVESGEGAIGGRWLEQRPGELLKYLICERGRIVQADEIGHALWPQAGPAALNNVRHYVHQLRDKLEPARTKRMPSSFIIASGSGYSLDRSLIEIDADRFEARVEDGMRAHAGGDAGVAAERLEESIGMYRGEFLGEDVYAEWAFAERDRLRALAGRALRTASEIRESQHDLETATEHMARLAELEPYDVDVQRRLIGLCLRQGRRSEAMRRYNALRTRLQRDFGEQLDFDLTDLKRAL
jgi:DNA-binding SARP family transcriptional activator